MGQSMNIVFGLFVRVCWLLLWVLLAGILYIGGHNPNPGFRLYGRVAMYDWPGQIVWYQGPDNNVELVQGVTTIGLLPGIIIGQTDNQKDKGWFLIRVSNEPNDAPPIVIKFASQESIEQTVGRRISEFELYREYPSKLLRYHDTMVRWLWVIAVLFVLSMIGFVRIWRLGMHVGHLLFRSILGNKVVQPPESSQSQ
jgi:hypothetical protein